MTISPDGPRILVVDSYDSFTNNLASLAQQAIPDAIIHIIQNDELQIKELSDLLPRFSAIIVGPGPGSPLKEADTGFISQLWDLADAQHIPILGVCLGMQCLAVRYGATIRRLDVVKHGQTSRLTHCASDVFEGVHQGCEVVRYHSLCVELGHTADLVVLAWADDAAENGSVPMAIRHRSKPFWAVQYHPESVRTDGSGLILVQNFWRAALRWRVKRAVRAEQWDEAAEACFSAKRWPLTETVLPRHCSPSVRKVNYTSVPTSHLSLPEICELLDVRKPESDFVLLDSAAKPGKHSIIGCLHPETAKIQHVVGSPTFTMERKGHRQQILLDNMDIWSWLAEYMARAASFGGDESVPFWGGLVGYLSYDAGVEQLRSLHHFKKRANDTLPDINLVMIERSVVVDVETGRAVVQSILLEDDEWVDKTACRLRDHVSMKERSKECTTKAKAKLIIPDKARYISKIKEAQSSLAAGESYELCLTAQTQLLLPKIDAPAAHCSWDLFKRVRAANPAPFAAYLRLQPATLVSSSPERFLSYSRPPHQTFQLRPIKGTVKKVACPTRKEAEAALGTAKEIAENLMIVDLIRHDLHGVVGQDVSVKQFCAIEEYETVWQLVSVIEGRAPDAVDPQLGWEVLRHSLPPGSMTGAPKKRSVELLDDLEDTNRGIYSGVVGYWDVGGGGDWSVVIRSCFKVEGEEDEDESGTEGLEGFEGWHLGAGGAITALSDPEAEWEEMLAKLQSVTRAFSTRDIED